MVNTANNNLPPHVLLCFNFLLEVLATKLKEWRKTTNNFRRIVNSATAKEEQLWLRKSMEIMNSEEKVMMSRGGDV